jgi:hypothetical protein
MRESARFRIKYWLQIGYNLPGLSFLSRLPSVRFRAGCADGRLVTGSRAGCYKLVTAPLGRFFRRPERGRDGLLVKIATGRGRGGDGRLVMDRADGRIVGVMAGGSSEGMPRHRGSCGGVAGRLGKGFPCEKHHGGKS